MQITIHNAQMNHAAAIAALTHQLGYAVTEHQTIAWLSELLASTNHYVVVALNPAGQLCGWLVAERAISLESGIKAEITGLVVGESFRRFGVGKELVLAALRWAKALTLPKMIVRSNVQREVSHQFYQQLGFTLIKTTHHYELKL